MALKRQQTQPSSMIQIQKGNYKNVSIVLQHKGATYYYYLVLLFFVPIFCKQKKTRKEKKEDITCLLMDSCHVQLSHLLTSIFSSE